MKFAYQNGLPLIPIVIKGKAGKISLNAHIDFAASKTLVPQKIASELELTLKGHVPIATASGVSLMPLYKAKVIILDKELELSIICSDLPKESPVNSILGRDVLDIFKVCLDGKKEEITFFNP
jgi:predicted aspartyl protease